MKIAILNPMKSAGLFAVFILLFTTTKAQDNYDSTKRIKSTELKITSTEKCPAPVMKETKIFGVEEECIDSHARIETLEVGFNSHQDVAFFTSIHFPVDDFASGRLFIASFRINKNGNGKPGHYSTGALDLTLFNSPIDLTVGLDNDRLGKNPYRRSEFVGLAFYLNDIPAVHKTFHILRYSPGYHFYHTGEMDSSKKTFNGVQHSLFIQTQPIKISKNFLLSTETYCLARKGLSLLEFDLGFRHKHLIKERFVFGTTVAFQNRDFHGILLFGRLSIMQTTGVKTNWGKR